MESINTNYSRELAMSVTGKPFKGPTLFIKGGKSDYIQEQIFRGYITVVSKISAYNNKWSWPLVAH
jgi:hypothetical protein